MTEHPTRGHRFELRRGGEGKEGHRRPPNPRPIRVLITDLRRPTVLIWLSEEKYKKTKSTTNKNGCQLLYKRGLRRQGSRLHRIKSQLCPRRPVFISIPH